MESGINKEVFKDSRCVKIQHTISFSYYSLQLYNKSKYLFL